MKPEKLVELEVKVWTTQQRWFVTVIDSKATYSTARGGYKKSRSASEGTPDLIGSDCYGQAVSLAQFQKVWPNVKIRGASGSTR